MTCPSFRLNIVHLVWLSIKDHSNAIKENVMKFYLLFEKRDGFRNTQLDHRRIKQTLLRHKNKTYPKDPGTVEGIRETFLQEDILKDYGSNLEGDEDFYINTVVEKDFAFTMFASKFVIDFIEKNIEPSSRTYLMDGTFDSLPNAYYQLLVISIEYNNDVSIISHYIHLSVRPYYFIEIFWSFIFHALSSRLNF